jgi:hypothetical protein
MPERTASLVLADPVTFDGQTYTEIRLRTPRGREIREIAEYVTDTDKQFAMLSKLSGVPIGVFDEMLWPDLDALNDLLSEVMSKVPRTPSKSSDGLRIVSDSSPRN